MVIMKDNKNLLAWIVTQMGKEFAMKDLGQLHCFLGIEVILMVIFFLVSKSMHGIC